MLSSPLCSRDFQIRSVSIVNMIGSTQNSYSMILMLWKALKNLFSVLQPRKEWMS